LAVIPLVVLSVLLFRYLRIVRLRKRLRQVLADVPPALVEGWRRSLPKAHNQAGLSASEVLYQLSRIDRSPLSAYAPRQVPLSFEQLLTEWRQASPKLAPESLEREQLFALGHRGELLLAEELRAQGHDVQLEASPSQSQLPGWRAAVDGYAVHLLATLDVDEIQRFLDEGHDLPVVTLCDHAEAFIDHALVVALDPISAERVGLVAPNAARAHAGQDSEAPSASSPAPLDPVSQLGKLVLNQAANPLLMSVFQSAQLAAQGNKDWVTAAKNSFTDQAGSAVGGWAGARAGAIAGGMLGPLGAAAGGWLGGLLGKKFGAGFALKKQEKKLRKLLAKQDEFLARIPAVANRAMLQQSRHLAVAAELIAPKTDGRFWPSLGALTRKEVAAQYQQWSQLQAARSQKLTKWLTQEHPDKALAERGIKLLSGSPLPWSSELLELHAELLFIGAQIKEERERLDNATADE
jgi:hypothetical protein